MVDLVIFVQMDIDALPEEVILQSILHPDTTLSESPGLLDKITSKDVTTQPNSVSEPRINILLKFKYMLYQVFFMQAFVLAVNCVLLNNMSLTTIGPVMIRGLLVIAEVMIIVIIVFVVGNTAMVVTGRDTVSHLKTD